MAGVAGSRGPEWPPRRIATSRAAQAALLGFQALLLLLRPFKAETAPQINKPVPATTALRRLSRRRSDRERQALAPSDDGERAWLFAGTHPVEDASKMLGGTDCRIIHRQQHVTY